MSEERIHYVNGRPLKEGQIHSIELKGIVIEQERLHARIKKIHNLKGSRLNNMKTAFRVELGELANEVRFFKDWSNKGPSDRKTILMEYIDGFTFLIEIAIEKDYQDEMKRVPIAYGDYKNIKNDDLNAIFEVLFTNKFEKYFDFIRALQLYLGLGHILGFDKNEILLGYHEKNKINHERQDSGY